MKIDTAIERLVALAQRSRLSVFRLLVEKGPDGMPAGEIAERLKIAPNALSFHLKGLSNAGLLKSWQQGRFVYYAPDFKAMNGLVDYLTENCCAGSAPAGTACATTPANCKEN
ncbi:MAG TPA: metalloregulator ArsR/SmtB family transcription factor [Solimonas sp.]